MSEHTRYEQPPIATPPAPAEAAGLRSYTRGLVREAELSDLILGLEALAAGDPPPEGSAPGLKALADGAGLNLGDPEAVREAILVLGERAQALRALRPADAAAPAAVDERSAEAVTAGLLGVLEACRARYADDPALPDHLHAAADGALAVYRRNLPPRSEREERWWELMGATIHERLIPAYARLAPRLTAVEDHPVQGALLRSRLLMAALVAAPGLVTWPMPVSTPLIMGMLAALGAFALHPLWVGHLAAPLNALRQAVAAQGPHLARLCGERAFTEADFSLSGVLADLMPRLECVRLARGADAEALRQEVSRHFDELEAPFEAHSQRSPRYFHHLRTFCEGLLVQRLVRAATSRARLEAIPAGRILDHPWASALVGAIVTLPLSWLASRISPLPQSVDWLLMVTLFTITGWRLPSAISGTRPAYAALIDELSEQQAELDRLP